MANKELEDLLLDDSPIEDVKLDIEKIKENVPLYSNEKLCEMVVCDRYFGFGQNIAIICMNELSKRRLAGDTFNFEEYINKFQNEMPVLDFSVMPDIRTILHQAIGRKLNK